MLDVTDRLDAGFSVAPRSHFPLLATTAYLNSAGMGLIPGPVKAKTLDFANRLADRGTLTFFSEVERIMMGPREAAARLFNAPVSSIAVINSVSEAISQIAAWRRPRAGENVVLIDIDHRSTSYPWLRSAQDTGVEIRFVHAADDLTSLSFDRVAQLVDRNTAVISISHVQWTTGLMLDLNALSDLARSNDALLVIDATHSAGVMPLDAPASGVDVLATGSFKWLCAYSGTGACYLRPGLAEEIRPIMVGSRTKEIMDEGGGLPVESLSFPHGAQRLEYGSSAQVLRIAYTEVIDYMMDLGIGEIHTHVQRLGQRLAEGLVELGADLLTPLDPGQRAGVVTARFPTHDAFQMADDLERMGVVVIVRMGGSLRFSPHMFNNMDDIERALDAIRILLKR